MRNNKLTPLLDVDQHCVQVWFQLIFYQFQTEDSDSTQCIVQVVCGEVIETQSLKRRSTDGDIVLGVCNTYVTL